MSILERFRAAPPALPAHSHIGTRWQALGSQRGTAVGMDLGAGSLKLAQVRWTRQGARLENFAIVPVPHGLMDEGVVSQPQEMGELIRSAMGAMNLTQRTVGACIGGPSISLQFLHMRVGSEAELREAMKYEAPQHLPIPEAELVFDFAPVPDAQVPDRHLAVLLAGAHRRVVDATSQTLSQAGLRPNVVEPDCLAALRSLEWTGAVGYNSPDPIMLLDIGESATRLHLMRYGVPVVTRSFSLGVRQLRTALMDTHQLSHSDAEMALRHSGMEEESPLAPTLESMLTGLLDELRLTFDVLPTSHRGLAHDRLIVMGGGAAISGLVGWLRGRLTGMLALRPEFERLRVEEARLDGLEIGQALGHVDASLAPLLMTALGSALREGAQE